MGKQVEQKNPATGEIIGSAQNQTAEDVVRAIEKSRVAQKEWAKLSFKERAKYITKIQSFMARNADAAAALVSQCNGKTRLDALTTEVMPCVLGCKWYAANTATVLKPQKLPSGSIVFANKSNTLVYEPVGVVGIISPWNYPLSIPFGEVIMGLMAGNGVILKVASNVTLIGNFISEAIKSAELPDGLFAHVVVGGADAGPAMLAGGVNKLFFTGSVRVGKQLMREAADTLTPLSLELGGNDPMVVLEDASIERAVNCACWAGYQNAGQSCGGVERVFVHRSLYDKFLAQVVEKTKALRHGPDMGDFTVDIGAITTQGQYDTIKSQVDEAVAQGAVIVAQSQPVGDCSGGLFFPATVLTGCTPDMRIMKEETFGPVLPVVPFDTEDEVVQLANNIDLALTSSVFSNSRSHAERVAKRLESGVVSINDHLYSHGMSEAPWGGWKLSGLGRTHGYLGLKEMCNVKCINQESIPIRCIPRNLWWYPQDQTTYDVIRAAIRFASPASFSEFWSSLGTLLTKGTKMFSAWNVTGGKKK